MCVSWGFIQTVPSCSSHRRVLCPIQPPSPLSLSLTAQCKRPRRPHHRKRSGRHQTLNARREPGAQQSSCASVQLFTTALISLSLIQIRFPNACLLSESHPIQPLPEKLSSTQINAGGQGLVKKGAGPLSGNSNYITIWLAFSVMCGQSYAMQSGSLFRRCAFKTVVSWAIWFSFIFWYTLQTYCNF